MNLEKRSKTVLKTINLFGESNSKIQHFRNITEVVNQIF